MNEKNGNERERERGGYGPQQRWQGSRGGAYQSGSEGGSERDWDESGMQGQSQRHMEGGGRSQRYGEYGSYGRSGDESAYTRGGERSWDQPRGRSGERWGEYATGGRRGYGYGAQGYEHYPQAQGAADYLDDGGFGDERRMSGQTRRHTGYGEGRGLQGYGRSGYEYGEERGGDYAGAGAHGSMEGYGRASGQRSSGEAGMGAGMGMGASGTGMGMESGGHRQAGFRGRGPKQYTRSDDRILEDVNERLTEDDLIDAGDITVKCANGVVTLEGSVEERWMKHRAEDIADACSGVKQVENQVQVKPRWQQQYGEAGAGQQSQARGERQGGATATGSTAGGATSDRSSLDNGGTASQVKS